MLLGRNIFYIVVHYKPSNVPGGDDLNSILYSQTIIAYTMLQCDILTCPKKEQW